MKGVAGLAAHYLRHRFRRLHPFEVQAVLLNQCNLKCSYCMPQSPFHVEREEVLSFEEISRLVGVAVDLGWRKVRLTGGEPLVRKDLHHLVGLLASAPGIEDLSLTTTGVLLVRRDPEQIYRSFHRRGWCGAGGAARRNVVERTRQHVQAATEAIRRLSIPHLAVDYSDYLERTEQTAQRIGEFFGLALSAADLNVRRELNHSNLRGRLTTLLRQPLMMLPRETRRRWQHRIPRRLVSLVFPEWKHVDHARKE